ncbi:BREX-1 system phosphatase PglZ type B [Aminobacter aminovorans]|uniref:BREX-1 system phosphatase PglZ type B n=1 Tax=Aminobacter aminovorans TaxID=83263 RepID=UPI002856A48B|nr:BREX-1 system phosphatase PglZ type B [Aminobacter aminovorans]MDR7225212.1 hypothetical protein [Aminobacter aminovorans]
MTGTATLADGLASALLDAADVFERGAHWPGAVLWPDPERQYSSVYESLREALATRSVALYRLGAYDPTTGTGPAIWLRCLLDTELPGASPAPGSIPVILLPGVTSAALKHPQTLDRAVRPLVELQYRGEVFRNRRQARDWSVGPFLRSPEQGLGLDVASDARTDDAAAAALKTLLIYPLTDLPVRKLTAEDFHRLIEPDEVRGVLYWISDPTTAKASRSAAEWESFRSLVRATYAIDVEAKGARQAAIERLAKAEGAWAKVLARVDDAPQQWRTVCEQLRAAEPSQQGLFEDASPGTSADNQHQEALLARDFERAADLPHAEAMARVIVLEDQHRPRRGTRWARLGEAPLAQALEPLARLAAGAREAVPGGDVPGIAQAYVDEGCSVDMALIDAVAAGGSHVAIVGKIARSLYLPWLDDLANRFRRAMEDGGALTRTQPIKAAPGTCMLFVDGLRFDLGRRLAERLSASESVRLNWRLAPIPTITATAKPIVTPVADQIGGVGRLADFLPLEASSGKPATTDTLRAAMRARGVDVLLGNDTRGPSSPDAIGWTECGNLDKDGHSMGARLAAQVANEIESIAHRVDALRRAGWARVRIVTDHGWLLVPGGLPKATIAASVVETAWSRVARLGDGAAPEVNTMPWHWDDSVRIAVPPGASAFRAGEEYAHGGISPQECVIPDILVGDEGGAIRSASAKIQSIAWRRYRLSVTLTSDTAGHEVEVRLTERDPASRVAAERIGGDGSQIDLRVDPDMDEQAPVFVVLLDMHGSVVDARKTNIGER